jgi:hypothetical protein
MATDITAGMSDENYGICRSCRFCRHESEMPLCCGIALEEYWMCTVTSELVDPAGGCERFRPGFCGTCSNHDGARGICRLVGAPVDELDVCTGYDPFADRR